MIVRFVRSLNVCVSCLDLRSPNITNVTQVCSSNYTLTSYMSPFELTRGVIQNSKQNCNDVASVDRQVKHVISTLRKVVTHQHDNAIMALNTTMPDKCTHIQHIARASHPDACQASRRIRRRTKVLDTHARLFVVTSQIYCKPIVGQSYEATAPRWCADVTATKLTC